MIKQMIRQWIGFALALGLGYGVVAVPVSFGQELGTARAVVTADTRSNEAAPVIPREAVTALVARKRQEISGWTPLRGSHAGLQLVVLIDDSARSSLGSQLNDVRNFINAMPPSTQIAVAYMRNGSSYMAQNFTPDHAAAAQALRLPIGGPGTNASPYFCLQDLVKRWPEGGDVRREVVMVTDGIDRYSGRGFNPDNPYVQSAIRDAQRAGVVIYSIYFRDAGRIDRGAFATDSGQNYLVQVSQSTGGQAYYQGFSNPVSFQPFLSDIQHKLENQYELSFRAAPKKDLVSLQVKTTQPNTKLQAPTQVQVTTSPVQ
jgi:VWFA-related protein